MLGYHAKDIIGQDVLLFKHPSDKTPAILRKLAEPLFVAKCEFATSQHTQVLLNGPILVLVVSSPIPYSEKRWVYSLSKGQDPHRVGRVGVAIC